MAQAKTTTTTKTTTNQRSNTAVMTAVASSIDFIKSQIANDLLEAQNAGLLKLGTDDLRKISSIVEGSITQSFYKTAGQIESKL